MAEIIAPERTARGAGPGLSHWLGSKVLGKPLAMEAELAARLQGAIKDKAFDPAVAFGPMASKFVGQRAGENGYRVTDDGIAVVPVAGVLIDRGAYLGDLGGWMTTYEGLSEQVRRIAKDTAIRDVVLDIDSGGGMCAGLFDLCRQLGDLGNSRRIYAVAANAAYSAAYAIACCADEVYVTRGGGVGSIGVISMHMSYAEMLSQMGVEATIIHAGAHKANGNPYQALSHLARAERVAECDQIYDDFVAHVARERGIAADAVRATEARCFLGAKGVDARLADGVKSFDEVLAHIRSTRAKGGRPRGGGKKSPASASRTSPAEEKPGMSGNDNSGGQPDYTALAASIAAAIAAKPAQQLVAAPAQPAAASQPADSGEAASARIFAILDSEEGKKRPIAARKLAGNAKLSVDEAKALLADLPDESAAGAAADNPLRVAMRSAGTSAGVRPEAAAAVNGNPVTAGMPSLGDKFAARFKSNNRRNRS